MTSLDTLHLDAKTVHPGRWSNRHSSAFTGADFEQLKKDIDEAGGNVQPIKVHRISDGAYEIVFGHRRHRACLELGLPVMSTVVTNLGDIQLWSEMERENRARVDLSPFEQGLHYRRALDYGLFPSTRKLAQAIGVDFSQASKVIKLARLPELVVKAFCSPRDIQVNWSSELSAVADKDLDELLVRASQLVKDRTQAKTPRQVFEALVGRNHDVESFHTPIRVVTKSGARATIEASSCGVNVRISGRVDRAALEAALRLL